MIITLMRTMQHDFNTTFLFSTHDTRIIGAVETIYTLEDGKLTGCKTGQGL
jgi:putative ABC transport system ATP-binding protein